MYPIPTLSLLKKKYPHQKTLILADKKKKKMILKKNNESFLFLDYRGQIIVQVFLPRRVFLISAFCRAEIRVRGDTEFVTPPFFCGPISKGFFYVFFCRKKSPGWLLLVKIRAMSCRLLVMSLLFDQYACIMRGVSGWVPELMAFSSEGCPQFDSCYR